MWSGKCAACSINVWSVVQSVQCVEWSVSGAFTGAGTVCNVHCAVCRVQCAAYKRWEFWNWNRISQIKFYLLKLFIKNQKPKYIFWTGWDCWFLKALTQKLKFNLTYPKSFCKLNLRNTSFQVQGVPNQHSWWLISIVCIRIHLRLRISLNC